MQFVSSFYAYDSDGIQIQFLHNNSQNKKQRVIKGDLILWIFELHQGVQKMTGKENFTYPDIQWISYARYNERPIVKSVKTDSTDN